MYGITSHDAIRLSLGSLPHTTYLQHVAVQNEQNSPRLVKLCRKPRPHPSASRVIRLSTDVTDFHEDSSFCIDGGLLRSLPVPNPRRYQSCRSLHRVPAKDVTLRPQVVLSSVWDEKGTA